MPRSLFIKYLPKRYAVEKATVVDSRGAFSDEIDVVLFDRQYTPLIFEYHGQFVVPAEAVYAVFESKQEINTKLVKYAQNKGRHCTTRLYRTSARVQTIHPLETTALQPPLLDFSLSKVDGRQRQSTSI